MWNFEVIKSCDSLWSVSNMEKWKELLEISPESHVFYHPSLVKAWLETYIPIRDLSLIVIWAKSENNEAFLPLVLWKRNWKNGFIRSIVPIGFSDFDYHDPIFKNSPTDDEIQDFWTSVFDMLSKQYSYDEIILDGLHKRFLPKGYEPSDETMCPYLSLDNLNNNDDLMKFFSTSMRGDIRRQLRRMGEKGQVEFKEYNTPEEVSATFPAFMEAHKERWPNAYKAPFFHENLVKEGLASKVLHFSSLNIDGRPIAWHLGYSFKGVYYYYMPAGDKEFFKLSPVKIHLYFLLDRAISNGYVKYDHLKGDENYKSGWANGQEFVYTISLQSNSLSAKAKREVCKLKGFLKK